MHVPGGAGPKKPKKVAEIMLEYGFLKRLEEEGKNVKIGTEINDILFLDERDREIKERLEEEHLRKAKKPRPRDIVDFEEIKRNHAQKEYERLSRAYASGEKNQFGDEGNTFSQQTAMIGEAFKSLPREMDIGTGLGPSSLNNTVE